MTLAWANALRLICVIALLGLGFAHKPIYAEQTSLSRSDLQQYMLPDGSIPELCLTGAKGDSKGGMVSKCDACRLISALLVPPRTDMSGETIAFFSAFVFHVTPHRHVLRGKTPMAAPRGPPLNHKA
jgi:hypothetical protein